MDAYRQLERELEVWTGVPHVAACASGTAALHLALEAMRLPQGSYVLVPDLTMVAVARAVTLAGLRPLFAKCREHDLLVDYSDLHRMASHASAIVAVHTYGRRCDMERIANIASTFDCKVVEDLAEAHTVRPHPRTDAACYSFYRNKVVAGEEGGAVGFRDPGMCDLAKSLRCLGFTYAHDFTHNPRGHNYRLSNVHAELILASLRRVTESVYKRRQLEATYDEACPAAWRLPKRDCPWVYDMRIRGLRNQEEVVKAVPGARHCFKPMTMQEEYRNARGCDVSRALSEQVVYLPLVGTPESARDAMEVVRRVAVQAAT